MVRAVAYIRVSTDRQATDGTSLVTQRRRVVEYVTFKGYKLVKQFVEEGESAKTDNRPVLQEMLQFCEKERGGIDILIFPKIDRFARYSEDYHHLKRYLRELGIRIESIDERFDDSPSGRFLESMLAATAQFDNDIRSERTYNGMKEAAMQGRWVWRAPVGYHNVRFNDKATIAPDPETAPLVVEVFERLADGTLRFKDAREWLAERGVVIGKNGINHVVRNRAYLGLITAFGLNAQGQPPFIPLISQALFDRAQGAIQRKDTPEVYQRDNPEFPLRGTLFCECGETLTAGWSHGRSRRYPYYRCHGCPRSNLRREVAERAFVRLLQQLKTWLELDDEAEKALRAAWEADRSHQVQYRERHQQELDKLSALQKAVVLKIAEGVIPDHLGSEQLAEFDDKIRDLRVKLATTISGTIEPQFDDLVAFGKGFVQQVEAQWLESKLDEKQKLQKVLFPAGATVIRNRPVRTAQRGQLTGSEVSLFSRAPDLVDRTGIEPVTSSMPWKRSTD